MTTSLFAHLIEIAQSSILSEMHDTNLNQLVVFNFPDKNNIETPMFCFQELPEGKVVCTYVDPTVGDDIDSINAAWRDLDNYLANVID